MFVKIALPVPLRKTFDYRCSVSASVPRGARVRVPFGSRNLVGVVLGHSETSTVDRIRIRPVGKIIDREPVLPETLLSLLEWTAGYYHHPIGETIFTALPSLIRLTRSLYAEPAVCWALTGAGRALEDGAVKGGVQRRLLALFRQNGGALKETSLHAVSASARQSLRRMADKGWVEPVQCPPEATPVEPADTPANADQHTLNADQDAAVSAINAASGFASFVLHGVTGSGKTEVYIRTARKMLEQGRQVLILTPEIGLTPQLTRRLERRLGMEASVLHSGLNDSERLQAWRNARTGCSRLIIGTRSSIFTPAPQLGMIIIDEEHDLSYKQQDGLRYHARDVALVRARREGIPIVLGSATPSLESWANCQAGRHRLLSLPQRAGNAQPPAMQFLDMRKTPALDGLSPQLLEAIREQLGRNEQTLLFLNRRGYAPVLYCTGCGWIAPCRRCDARLTWHKRDQRLRCHHCGADFPAPDHCPECNDTNLTSVGEGTERIEDTLKTAVPGARLLRIDRDSMSRKHALKKALRQIHDQQVDILIGTQMLSKGHHFPDVTLVGVINADSALYSTDFRAPERLFQLVTQVAGRAGRAHKPGRVLIQTAHPDNPVYRQILRNDYPAFADAELVERRDIGYPPFHHFALLRAESVREDAALQFLQQARELAGPLLPESVKLSDAVPSPMQRRAGRWRAQLLAQCTQRSSLHPFLTLWLALLDEQTRRKRDVRWSIDIDPADMS